MTATSPSSSSAISPWAWGLVLGLVYALLLAIALLGAGLALLTDQRLEALFTFANQPWAGLLVGLLATALLQSSSTVTTIIVGLVAGGLPISLAIPMVMGSNVGTTVTNTLVSLAQGGDQEDFERAFGAATVHDFFNLWSLLLFFPLELTTHGLEHLALAGSHWLQGMSLPGLTGFNPIQASTQPLVHLAMTVIHPLPSVWGGLALLVGGMLLIFLSIGGLGRLLKQLLLGPAQGLLKRVLGQSGILALGAGLLITVLVQSSSTTTSLIVPLAGLGLLSLEEVYPFTLGANVGTCLTALLAALAVTQNPEAALAIALVHLLFNIGGVLVFYGLPGLRKLPLVCARRLAHFAAHRRYWALIYLLAVFFLLPGCGLLLSLPRS
ncbi:Na/Pi symporter [Synechocystis sp. LKSZ1]|uniref:Na/Pi symporter n=1 Tax=Synechocystis sp. LKSZ1 TaxID=3144951 RepID=UPI00336BBBD6